MFFCKDCKHFKKSFGLPKSLGECTMTNQVDLVTGKWEYKLCSVERFNVLGCGKEGSFFQWKY